MVIVLALLAAPVAAAILSWGSWGWAIAAGVVAAVEYATLRHSQRFSARVWRSTPIGRRHRNERNIERLYVVAAVAGVALFVRAVLVAL